MYVHVRVVIPRRTPTVCFFTTATSRANISCRLLLPFSRNERLSRQLPKQSSEPNAIPASLVSLALCRAQYSMSYHFDFTRLAHRHNNSLTRLGRRYDDQFRQLELRAARLTLRLPFVVVAQTYGPSLSLSCGLPHNTTGARVREEPRHGRLYKVYVQRSCCSLRGAW